MTTKSKLPFNNGFEIYKSNDSKLLVKLRNDIYFEMTKKKKNKKKKNFFFNNLIIQEFLIQKNKTTFTQT